MCKENLRGKGEKKILHGWIEDSFVYWEEEESWRPAHLRCNFPTSCFCLSTPLLCLTFKCRNFPRSLPNEFFFFLLWILCLGISFMVLIITYVWKALKLTSLSPTAFIQGPEFPATLSSWTSCGHLKFNISKAELVISSPSVMHTLTAEFSVPVNTILILPGDGAWRAPTPPHCITRCLLAIPRTQHVHEFPQVFTDAVLLGMLLVFIFQVPAQMLTHWWGPLPINYDFLSAFIGLPFCYDTYFTLGPCIH